MARQAHLRSDYGEDTRVREDRRGADVYPFPRYTERRTIQIKGQTVPPPSRRRRSPTAARMSARPDRLALWAVLLGLILIAMAAATAHAAAPHHVGGPVHVAHLR